VRIGNGVGSIAFAVIPAKAGIQLLQRFIRKIGAVWIRAFAGMTKNLCDDTDKTLNVGCVPTEP